MTREPFGDGSIYAVIRDPAAALGAAEIKAWMDERGRVTLDPDIGALPPHLVNGNGQWDVPSYVALLAEVVRVQGRLIGQLLHERGQPATAELAPSPLDAPRSIRPPEPGRHAASHSFSRSPEGPRDWTAPRAR